MKPRDNMIRLRQFKVAEKHRQVMQLESMISEFERMASELDAQIVAEEKKSGITDQNHFAYPTFAKAARTRRDNLMTSIRDLKQQKEAAEAELLEAEAELQKAERLEVREARAGSSSGADDQRKEMIG
ncbi:flagellar export protein FliJ [Oricola thermophila]|uniref:Flagellar export protein FliJ n=1 Tax=Oricola thermophila TaxID=2742145 RepID=A0A6N1VD45_9HYPH|nr:flagellar export protein FliJ [Oricola thermophila]QKV17059.1 flagellar export protein FliJ [Oricola thermophila]